MRVELQNLSGESLTATTPAGKNFHFGEGQTKFHIETEPIEFTRTDGSTFSVDIGSEVSHLEIYEGGYSMQGSASVWSAYTLGFELGLVVMFAALSLRMVKQLGYHSQDI